MPDQPFRSRLYLILDALPPGRGVTERVSVRERITAALAGGVGLVQYNGGHLSTRQMVDDAAELAWHCRKARVPLIVRERVDVALAATAEGVHLSGEDLPVAYARRLMGPHAVVGVSVASIADALEAQRQGASYIAVGPVYGPSELSGPLITPQALRNYSARVAAPVCIMGGITLENVEGLADLPAALIGVDSAVTAPADLQAAAHRLVQRLSLA